MARLSNVFRSSTSLSNTGFRFVVRTLMTTSTRAEKALEELQQNSYYEKYSNQIAKLQQTSPEEFLSRVEVLEKEKTPKKDKQPTGSNYSQLLNPKKPLYSADGIEASLDKIFKVDLISDKSAEEIGDIWRDYHLQKNFIAAVLAVKDFDDLSRRSLEFPTFLFPLPRGQGYEFMMSQFNGNCVHFTPLLYYQVHKENAPECLTLTYYTELKDSKKVVLMRGEYDVNIINVTEAQCLANQLQLYYVRPSDHKIELLEMFSKRPDEFKHMDLIREVENLTL